VLRIHPNARKHGVSDAEIARAFANAFETLFTIREDGSTRWPALGPDRAGNTLESLWVDLGGGDYLRVHRMAARKATIDLIRRAKKGKLG
jgi:uncharacterized DUF497 family protein